MTRAGLVLMAAGSSSRMGVAKQMLSFRGKPLVRHAAEVALESRCRPVWVVMGSQAETIETALEGLDVQRVINPRWEEGMGTSIQAGLRAAEQSDIDGVILALADQPLVTAKTLNRLLASHAATGQPIVASQYAGTVGVPVYFAREYFPHLMALEPAQGCKGVILQHPNCSLRLDCPEAEADVDTPADYQSLQAR